MLSIRRGTSAVLALLAVAVLVLSGCAHSGGAAAYIGDRSITESDLHRVSSAVDGLLPEGQRVNRAGVLAALVRGELARQVATRVGITITPGERDQYIAQQVNVDQNYAQLQPMLTNEDSAQAVWGYADYDLTLQRLGGFERFATEAQQVGVEINPRYGAWGYSQTDMGIDANGGALSRPVTG